MHTSSKCIIFYIQLLYISRIGNLAFGEEKFLIPNTNWTTNEFFILIFVFQQKKKWDVITGWYNNR